MPRWPTKKTMAKVEPKVEPKPAPVIAPVAPVIAPVIAKSATPNDELLVARARIIACRLRGQRIPESLKVFDHLRMCGKLVITRIAAEMAAAHAPMDQAEVYARKYLSGR